MYGLNCTSETASAFNAYLTQCSDDVAAASALGGTLPDNSGDLATCNASLSACSGNLSTCTANLSAAESDLAICEAASPPGRLLKTGQMTTYGAGSDGDLQIGLSRNYVDNGDGTITDTKTGLMWEKKSDDGSIHDKDDMYTWSTGAPWDTTGTAFTVFLATLNAGSGFAGHTDWRMPNLFELESIVDMQSWIPSVSSAFNTNCGPNSSGNAGCTVSTCSCTVGSASAPWYWSSSTNPVDPQAGLYCTS